MDSAAYVTNNVFTSRVTPNLETFLGQRALGAQPYSVGWQTLQLAYCYPSCPQVSHVLEGRDRDSHHAIRGPHSLSGGRCSYALHVFTSRTLAIRDTPTVTPCRLASGLYRKPKQR